MATRISISSCFEFAAAHRLNDPSLTPQENLALFGKCNRPNGHGHNYRLEVAIRPPSGSAFGMADLERIVSGTILDRFDHRNLNVDCEEFRTLNPTVEHIAAVCFDLLKPRFAASQVDLVRVTAWETSKTSATVEV
ncbi:MAG: 6-carboxytetrahydropterin synthase [Phycisphaerales bacterium]|nr:6-carboxytetrahydropterin synthase [Phycisphaerales bacterium]